MPTGTTHNWSFLTATWSTNLSLVEPSLRQDKWTRINWAAHRLTPWRIKISINFDCCRYDQIIYHGAYSTWTKFLAFIHKCSTCVNFCLFETYSKIYKADWVEQGVQREANIRSSGSSEKVFALMLTRVCILLMNRVEVVPINNSLVHSAHAVEVTRAAGLRGRRGNACTNRDWSRQRSHF